MKLIKTIVVFYLALVTSAMAITSPFQSLRYLSDARATGLSGCFVSMADDPGGVFYNPATISTVESKSFEATFTKHVLDINSGNVVYVKDFENIGRFAGFASYMNYGSFQEADNQGNKTGTFSGNDIAFGVSYSNELDTNLYYGVSVKLLWLNLEKSYSSAFAVDAGIFYQIPEKRTNIGLSILHAGTQLSTLEGENEPLPLDIRLGINNRLKGLPLLINFSLHHLADKTDKFLDKILNFSIGGEIYLGQYVQARLGYDNMVRRLSAPSNDKGFAGFSGGIGVKTKNFNLDYGLAEMGVAGFIHRFSVSLPL